MSALWLAKLLTQKHQEGCKKLLRHPIRPDPFDVFFLFLTLQSALIICKLNSVTGHMTRTDNDQ